MIFKAGRKSDMEVIGMLHSDMKKNIHKYNRNVTLNHIFMKLCVFFVRRQKVFELGCNKIIIWSFNVMGHVMQFYC